MRKLNISMLFQWVLFAPILLPISILTGAFEGIKKTLDQAFSDILPEVETESKEELIEFF